MAHYVVSDIHGEADRFYAMLENEKLKNGRDGITPYPAYFYFRGQNVYKTQTSQEALRRLLPAHIFTQHL